MAGSFPPQLNPGMFVPTSNVWDVSQLYSIDVNSSDFKELLVRLYQNVNNIALALNLKDTGYYTLQEFLNSQAYFPNPALSSTTQAAPVFRQVYRTVINFVGGIGAGVTTVAHNIAITGNYSFTRIYACASDTVGNNYYPIPWASAAGATNIEIRADLTNVIITNNSGIVFNFCYAVLEYIKN